MRVVRFLAQTPVASLLDDGEAGWQERGRSTCNDTRSRAFLVYAHRQIADLAEAGGWEAEYHRDVWQMHRLGFDGRRTLRFTTIPQPWLRELAKRWVRWRLSAGLGLEAAGARPVLVISRLARFLAANDLNRIADIDRPVLERYLADLRTELTDPQRHGVHIGLLNAFLAAIRRHGWHDGLAPAATFFAEDYPKRGERLPRALADQVMAQVEHPDNLARWENPAYQLVTLILIRCGLRITDALRLPPNCVVSDAEGAPYLRYHNHKMNREALVPIDEQLARLIGQQQRQVADRWPDAVPALFPRPTKNVDGQLPLSSATYRMALYRWLERCAVRDEHGVLAAHYDRGELESPRARERFVLPVRNR